MIGGKKAGKTRLEAFRELDIEPVELLPSGELRLPSGKIIGHRDYKHIYKQRPRLPDDREQVVINKLAIEYRRSKHGPLMIKQGEDKMIRMEQKISAKD